MYFKVKDSLKVEWLYDDGGSLVSYPNAIRLIIEKYYPAKKQYASWEEGGHTYRVTFQTMEECAEGVPSCIVKVLRKPKGRVKV